MTDLWDEIEDQCSYEISQVCKTFKTLPSMTPAEKKAAIVKEAFISNGGGFGWGVTRKEQINIDANGARLYELINGTSGDTHTLQHAAYRTTHRYIQRSTFCESCF